MTEPWQAPCFEGFLTARGALKGRVHSQAPSRGHSNQACIPRGGHGQSKYSGFFQSRLEFRRQHCSRRHNNSFRRFFLYACFGRGCGRRSSTIAVCLEEMRISFLSPQPAHETFPQVWQRLWKDAAGAAPKETVGSSMDFTFTIATATAAGAIGAVPLLLPAPTKLPGFTYVSVFLEALSVASTVGMTNPALSLSVFSAKGQLVEAAQVCRTSTVRGQRLPH